jgi:hypothetical protein
MGIPKRVAVGISGLAFAGATALTLGAATPASAQTVTTAPSHGVAGYGQSTYKHHWRSESWSYESWERWSCGCCCCC